MQSEIEKKLWRRVDKYTKWLRLVPFVRMVSVCNNLAIGNIKDESDIDLFVVAKTGRLFLARSFLTVLLHLLGVRRHHSKVKGRFCLSFFVDDSSLSLDSIRLDDDIYLALWIATQHPIIDDGVYDKFIAANRWIYDYNVVLDAYKKPKHSKSFFKRILEYLFKGRVGDAVEKRLMNWQINRSGKKAEKLGDKASIVISKNMLKFHNIDRRAEFKRRWYQRYDKNQAVTKEAFRDL